MPDFLSEPQRWVIPAVLIVSVAGVLLTLWRERTRPSSYTRSADSVEAWLAKSTAKQAAVDRKVLARGARAEAGDTETSARLEEAGRRAVECANRNNVLFRP